MIKHDSERYHFFDFHMDICHQPIRNETRHSVKFISDIYSATSTIIDFFYTPTYGNPYFDAMQIVDLTPDN